MLIVNEGGGTDNHVCFKAWILVRHAIFIYSLFQQKWPLVNKSGMESSNIKV